MNDDTKHTLCRLVEDHMTCILRDAKALERHAKRPRFVFDDTNNESSGGSTRNNYNVLWKRRVLLDVEDINHALIYRGLDPMFTTVNQQQQEQQQNHSSEQQQQQQQQRIDLNEFLTSEMQERPPTEIVLNMHWLAVDGVQPQIPQNPTRQINNNNNNNKNNKNGKLDHHLETSTKGGDNTNSNTSKNKMNVVEDRENGGTSSSVVTGGDEEGSQPEDEEMDGSSVSVRQLLPRLLSEELQLYFTRVTVAMERGSPVQQDAALLSVARDSGTQELVPFFSRYISRQIYKSIGNAYYCRTLIRLAHALFVNPRLHVELHLHQILPAIITCVVAKTLSSNNYNHHHNNNHHHHQSLLLDHWSLRQQAALTLAQACRIFGNDYTTLKPRVMKTLCEAMGPDKPLTTQFGGIVGISLFGPKAVDAFILPLATLYWQKWESTLQHLQNQDPEQQLQLQQCQHALLEALGIFFQNDEFMEQSKCFDIKDLEDIYGEKLVPLQNQCNPSEYLTCII